MELLKGALLMKQNKNRVLIGILYAVIIAMVNVLIFVIFKKHTDVFWISYGFLILAFIVQIISMLLSFRDSSKIEAIFFGIPLASFSIYYLFVALIVGIIFMIFQGASTTLAIVLQLIVLASYLVIAIVSLMARDIAEDGISNIKEKVTRWKTINNDTELLYKVCEDPELKVKLRKLNETIKYSDPISNSSVEDIERRLCSKISELRVYHENDKVEEAKKACSELELLCIERNSKLSISK